MIAPAMLAGLLPPGALEQLSPAAKAVLPYAWDVLLRPEQRFPIAYRGRKPWTRHGCISGRGWGKSMAIACAFNRRIETGACRAPALAGPTEERVSEVQIDWLIATSPPWFRAERYKGSIVWPNGVQAVTFTSFEAERARGNNFDLGWMTELVDWQYTTRKAVYDNFTTSVRSGPHPQTFWDTTSKGRNEIITGEIKANADDPASYPIIRGTIFDNPIFLRSYLRSEVLKYGGTKTRRGREELLGEVFAEAAGALWSATWLDAYRVQSPPTDGRLRLVCIDPAQSTGAHADETGYIFGANDARGHAYAIADRSGKHTPDQWGDLAIADCVKRGAAGVIIERNKIGDGAVFTLKSRAQTYAERHGITLDVRVIPRADSNKPFPSRTDGVIYVRELNNYKSKIERGEGPANETEAGRVHLVGALPELEAELTTYDGSGPSPNRFDAFVFLVTELRGLGHDARAANPIADARTAAAAHSELRRVLFDVRRRRVGL